MTLVFPFGRRQLAIHFVLGLVGGAIVVAGGWYSDRTSTFTPLMFTIGRAVSRIMSVLVGWILVLIVLWFVMPSRFAPTVRDGGFRAWVNPFIPWPVEVAWVDVVEVARDGRALKVVTGQGRVVRLPVALLADGSGLARLVRERAGHSPGVDAGS